MIKVYILVPTTDDYHNLSEGRMYIVEKIDDEAMYFTDNNGETTFVAIDEFPKSFDLLTF